MHAKKGIKTMKAKKILLAISAVALLASCGGEGKEISQDEAKQVVTTAQQKQKKGEVTIPKALSIESVMSVNGKVFTKATVSMDAEAKKLHSYLEMGEMKMETWAFKDGEKFILAYIDEGEKFYVTATAEEFDQYFSEMQYQEMLDQFYTQAMESFAVVSDAMKNISLDGKLTSFARNVMTSSYHSKGDGNLTATYLIDVAGTIGVAPLITNISTYVKGTFAIDNYLPVRLEVETKGEGVLDYLDESDSASASGEATMKVLLNFDWGKASINLPDLTQFSSEATNGEGDAE